MIETMPDEAIVRDWDERGVLSLVVQGALLQTNLVETANHCRHWRALFPAAELVLVMSVTDVIHGDVVEGVFTTLQLVPAVRHDGYLQAAVETIMAVCDRVAMAEPALPLPPIKSDSPKLNNMNFQLAAARRGLALATGTFVLRIRSDLIFLDRRFLDQYAAADALPRGKAAMFGRRVLISWLFTLNPYTNERLPLHFSDWFHFGLTEDVRHLWRAPFVTLADSMYYRGRRHAAGSNAAERLFITRLAVEQHLVYQAFKDRFPDLTLAYHNDPSSIDLAMDILIDNFSICDIEQAGCVFNKYSSDFTDYEKQLHCITRDDWFAMARARDTDYRLTLSSKIEAFDRPVAAQLRQTLPRTFDASRFHTQDGRLLNGEIVAIRRDGVLFWGPYTTLARGRYRAAVNVTTLDGAGSVTLRVTMNSGKELLAERVQVVEPGSVPDIAIPFDVSVAKASELEVICRFENLSAFAASGVTFSERAAGDEPVPKHQQTMPMSFDAARLSTRDGHLVDGAIVAAGTDGTLFYGPYAGLAPGRYLARVNTTALEGPGDMTLKVVLDAGDRVVAEKTLSITPAATPALDIPFDIPGDEAVKVELVCTIKGVRRIAVSGIVIEDRAADIETRPPTRSLRRLFR